MRRTRSWRRSRSTRRPRTTRSRSPSSSRDLVYNGQWYTPLRKALSAFVDSTQETVTGDVKLKLYKGNSSIPASVTSPYSLYSEDMATFNEDDCYDQADSAGFINLFGLPLKVRALNDQMLYKKTGEHFPSVEK